MTVLHSPKLNDVLILIDYHNAKQQKNLHLGVFRKKNVLVLIENLTCKEYFKSYFQFGRIAHTSLTLNSLCQYLSQFNWKCLKNTKWEQALTCVCDLANHLIKAAPGSNWNERISSQLYFNCDLQRWQKDKILKLL